MADLAEVVHLFGPNYRQHYGEHMLPSHVRALRDIAACRTEFFGGHMAQCDQCGHQHYSYHSCRNRSCPQCHTNDGIRWLEKRHTELLPIPYFHAVFTLPEDLRSIAWRHQKKLYAVLFKAAAETLLTLCNNPNHVGGIVGMMGVLHTWTRQLHHHPHVHFLVTGGGLSTDGHWLAARKRYLVPVAALSLLFRAKFMDLARKACPDETFPESAWKQNWVVYCKPVKQGNKKLLDYLGRYVHRIAITNQRILAIHKGQVTFSYKDSKNNHWKRCTLPGEEFLRRFLQHVLPRGFHKVRYYGLLSPRNRFRLRQLQWLLASDEREEDNARDVEPELNCPDKVIPCPVCKDGLMLIIIQIPRLVRGPP